MKPEELKAIDERAEKAGRIVLALGGSDDLELTLIESVGDIPALLAEVERLKAALEAAVMDMSVACIAGEACAVCANCRDRGDQFPCAISDKWCCGSAWEWRGMKGE